MNIALLIAGGSGARMHQNIPKQFLTVNERPVIVYTLEAFQNHPEIDEIGVVCIEGWESVLWAYANQFNITKLKCVMPGGKNGQDSIRNGVFELEKHHSPDDIVLIHDAIRPMVSAEIISDCIRVTQMYGNAITVIPCAEAMMQTEDGIVSTGSYPRNNLKRKTICIDDPIGHFDDMNILGFTDMIRCILEKQDCQIIMSTHEEKVYQIMKRKLDPNFYNTSFIQLDNSKKVVWDKTNC